MPAKDRDISHLQLELDSVFLENGLCIGPDKAGTLDSLTSGLVARRKLAQALMDDLAVGLPVEAIIEKLQQYMRPDAPPRSTQYNRGELVRSFAHWTIHQLKHLAPGDLSAWIASFGEPPRRTFRSA